MKAALCKAKAEKMLIQWAFYAAVTLLDMALLSIFAHVNFLKQTVYIYCYRMLFYAVISSAVLLVLYLFTLYKKFFVFDLSVVASAIIIATLFLFLFIFAGPSNIDRSYTIFSLASMSDNADKIYTLEEMEEKTFAQKSGVKRRMEEQTSIGNMETVDGGYRISRKGKRLIERMRLVERFYPVDIRSSIYPNEASQE